MDTAEHNKALVRGLVDVVNDRRLDDIAEVASGQVARDAARWVGPFAQSFPDFHMRLVDAVAEPDKVVAYFKCSGTQQGEWHGHPPTGRRFDDVDEIYIFRVKQGKLDSAIAVVEDNLTRLQQLALPTPTSA
jgi:predicted ester cyclase